MEKWIRFENLVGFHNFNNIKNKTILIIGLGGVGGYALESIVRCGIEKLIIVDNDKIDITNMNRQIIANINNISEYKVDEWKKRIKLINPDCEVIAKRDFIDEENIEDLFKFQPDYVIDACDTIDTKKAIIRKCIKDNVKLISSMGTGNKLDPSKLEIIDIRKTSYDPLARAIRKMVRDEKITEKIMVISSKEKPLKSNNNFILSNSFVPATAGLLCTSYIINDIIEHGDINEKN